MSKGLIEEMILITVTELAALYEKVAHDSEMLRADGETLTLALRYLGLDESGCDIQEIPEQIKRNRAELIALRARVAELEAATSNKPWTCTDGHKNDADFENCWCCGKSRGVEELDSNG